MTIITLDLTDSCSYVPYDKRKRVVILPYSLAGNSPHDDFAEYMYPMIVGKEVKLNVYF